MGFYCKIHLMIERHTVYLQVHTCPPAMGYSFAAGTTDGPGAFDFIQSLFEFGAKVSV